MTFIPADLPDKGAHAIVRQVEDHKKIEQIAKQQREMEKRRREEAMRDAEAAKRNQSASNR